MAAKPTEEWRNSSPVKIDYGGLSSDQSTSYEEEVVTPPKEKAHRTVEVMAHISHIFNFIQTPHISHISLKYHIYHTNVSNITYITKQVHISHIQYTDIITSPQIKLSPPPSSQVSPNKYITNHILCSMQTDTLDVHAYRSGNRNPSHKTFPAITSI